MQAVTDLRLLQVAQVGVQARQPHRRVIQCALQLQFTIDMVVTQQGENIPLQLAGAARVE
ncbi:hypothetical protein D3C81_764070 [compost metagenome]